MDTTLIFELIRAVWRELVEWRSWVVGVFIVVSFGVLAVGVYWPEKYEANTMLYADTTNIIEPLLKGRAEVTAIDRSEQARDVIYTRRILERVAENVGLIDQNTPVSAREAQVQRLRKAIRVKNEGKNYFRVIYSHQDQEQTFEVLNAVVDAFISDTSEQRRQESRSAYEFIEEQVKTYKQQLLQAEQKLKEFKSSNLDGDQGSVNRRISDLRVQIEELKLQIGEIEARNRSLAQQLKSESEYLTAKNKVEEERDRLASMKARLDNLRLSYQETYPDIVSLKQQIAAQELVIDSMTEGGRVMARVNQGESAENPLYEELRIRKSDTELELGSQRKRLEALKRMLTDEYKRAERIAEREAELSELTRDYNVTRGIYEEMLERKEKARLSMTLDIEGQGVSFKIQEPAVYPLVPSGLRFIHFAMIAPLVGFVVAIGLVIVYVILDPRLRSPTILSNELTADVELLAVIPHVRTNLSTRLVRTDMLILMCFCLAAAAVYGVLVWMRLTGMV